MTFTFTGKKYDVTDELKAYAEKKIGKIDRLFRRESDAFVTFSKERGRFWVEITLKNNGMFYRVTENTGDMRASIDSACASLERQVLKHKDKLEAKLRDGAMERTVEIDSPEEVEETASEYKIVRQKKFSIKPMTPEEACLQMDLLGHEFFAFRNVSEENGFAIVYKRNNGDYGMISATDDED